MKQAPDDLYYCSLEGRVIRTSIMTSSILYPSYTYCGIKFGSELSFDHLQDFSAVSTQFLEVSSCLFHSSLSLQTRSFSFFHSLLI